MCVHICCPVWGALNEEDISARWLIPTFRQKQAPPAWVKQALQLREHPDANPLTIHCITQLPLEHWASLTKDGIKNTILRPGKRFQAALFRVNSLLKHLERFLKLVPEDTDALPHLIEPSWGPLYYCTFCQKNIPIWKCLWTIQSSCNNAKGLAMDLVRTWRWRFATQQQLLQRVLDTFGLPQKL